MNQTQMSCNVTDDDIISNFNHSSHYPVAMMTIEVRDKQKYLTQMKTNANE